MKEHDELYAVNKPAAFETDPVLEEIRTIKKVLLQQLEVLEQNMTKEGVSTLGVDQVLHLADVIGRTVEEYVEIHRVEERHMSLIIPNYVSCEEMDSRPETAE